MRQLPTADYLSLKAATRDLVALIGGPKRAAAITRGVESRISEAGAPQCEDRFAAIDQIADLEAECGSPVVTRALAEMAGFSLTAVDEVPKPKTASLHQMFVSIVRECGDVEEKLAEALADGSVSAFEANGLIKKIDQAVERLQTLKGELRAQLRGGVERKA